MPNKNASNIHSGHRKRIKKRYREEGGEGFNDHELLELLLFYSIPRKNTNEVAHELYERFGSISRIASADMNELKLVDGVGDNTTVLLNLVMSFAKRIASEGKVESKRLDTLKKLVEYANSFVFGATGEHVYLILMDSSLRIIDTRLIASGAVDEARPIIKKVLEFAILKRASAVALAHNHPNGGVEASSADVEFTTLLNRELDVVGIRFVEHVIVDGKSYNPIVAHINGEDYDENMSFALDDPRANG